MAPRGRPKKIKVEEVKVDGQPAVEMTPTELDAEMAPTLAEESAVKSMPEVNGVQVLAILNDGRETETEFHCALANGTTAHVSKKLFE